MTDVILLTHTQVNVFIIEFELKYVCKLKNFQIIVSLVVDSRNVKVAISMAIVSYFRCLVNIEGTFCCGGKFSNNFGYLLLNEPHIVSL